MGSISTASSDSRIQGLFGSSAASSNRAAARLTAGSSDQIAVQRKCASTGTILPFSSQSLHRAHATRLRSILGSSGKGVSSNPRGPSLESQSSQRPRERRVSAFPSRPTAGRCLIRFFFLANPFSYVTTYTPRSGLLHDCTKHFRNRCAGDRASAQDGGPLHN